MMKILLSKMDDIDAIFKIYDDATAYQKTVTDKHWRGFERTLVEKEINENRHYKIMEEDEIGGTFLIAYNNPVIWEDMGADNAIYLHRIAIKSSFRGRAYTKKIVTWAIDLANDNKKSYVRLDTHSGNEKINTYYKNCGFTYKGIRSIDWNKELPEHYKDGPFSIFELAIIS
ncbi:L-amino acid N-acyltransferase YncA [Gelidibacter algens]|uniref:L-amino acid N-acyltransferase YncA n=1 Tax=Gelidibacter algens TaxID=49280 RepID=A0A327SIK2_9FLAO|nr:GNAT family N-acetyltransferase [Gelidibacter algens]RAJ27744.1 L-amino acid N-acyltransferase YncA [Gelidibacter algens]